jgi:hypothetical protein
VTSDLTVGETLAAFRRANGIPAGEAATWTCDIGPVRLRLPNFRWRRRAVLLHDLHHVLTGFPCTLRGEFQVAAWEFAAGRFPHAGATLFCLPLVALGMLWSPRAIWSAFLRGRRARSLYGIETDDALLALPLGALRARVIMSRRAARPTDVRAFCLLVAAANALLLTPAAVTAALLLAL